MRRRTERAKRPPLGHVRNATHGKVGGGIYGNSFYEEYTKPFAPPGPEAVSTPELFGKASC